MSIVKTYAKGQIVLSGKFHPTAHEVVLPDSELIWEAAEIKARFSISYADCFAAATALRFEASILTGDPKFKKLGDLVKVVWL